MGDAKGGKAEEAVGAFRLSATRILHSPNYVTINCGLSVNYFVSRASRFGMRLEKRGFGWDSGLSRVG